MQTRPEPVDRNGGYFGSGPAIVLYTATARLLLHLFTASRYGIFRDELYNLACSQHLDWGGIDHPPVIDLIAWFARHVFGESLLGLRLLPAMAGAGLIVLTGVLTREMGEAVSRRLCPPWRYVSFRPIWSPITC